MFVSVENNLPLTYHRNTAVLVCLTRFKLPKFIQARRLNVSSVEWSMFFHCFYCSPCNACRAPYCFASFSVCPLPVLHVYKRMEISSFYFRVHSSILRPITVTKFHLVPTAGTKCLRLVGKSCKYCPLSWKRYYRPLIGSSRWPIVTYWFQ